MDIHAELTAVVAALDAGGAEYALVGGLALAVHGVARATTDIDLLILPEQTDQVLVLVKNIGFRFRASPMRFPDGMSIQRVSKIEEGETLTLDLLMVEDNLRDAWDSRARYDTPTGSLSVIGREALIAMKTWAGRPQDLADVQRLTEADR